MAVSNGFRIVRLPKLDWDTTNDQSMALAQKFRELRLYALKTAPQAFASSFEAENARGLEHTFERLNNPKAVHFFGLKIKESDGLQVDGRDNVEQVRLGELIGVIVLLGPEVDAADGAVSARMDPFARMTAPGSDQSRDQEKKPLVDSSSHVLHYHLNGMFVAPSARGQGLGLGLINDAVATAELQARQMGKGVRVSISVDTENVAARRLYERAGFVATGEETYTQRPRLVLGELTSSERVAIHMDMSRK